uniref:Uncharacterized protein n=1 Tax=Arundo donax TaxID=35708 RepID=A0A0A8Y0I1_ARUDO
MALTFHHGKPSRASLRTGWASPLEAMT